MIVIGLLRSTDHQTILCENMKTVKGPLKDEREIHNSQSTVSVDHMTRANHVQDTMQKTLDWKAPPPGQRTNVQHELSWDD